MMVFISPHYEAYYKIMTSSLHFRYYQTLIIAARVQIFRKNCIKMLKCLEDRRKDARLVILYILVREKQLFLKKKTDLYHP